MINVIVVCEGQTEEVFVNKMLLPELATRSVFIQPRLIATSRRSKGGALDGQRVLRFLRNTLREREDTYVTTFFDMYGLPTGFPGLSATVSQTDPLVRAAAIEIGFHTEVINEAECREDRFIPHIQPYEFESLLFSDVLQFAKAEPTWKPFVSQFETIAQSASSPEHINDGPETHPSARLRHLRPPYKKVSHGYAISARIGLNCIRAKCRHFDKWLSRIETVQPLKKAV